MNNISNFQLTDEQKKLMVKVLTAPTPAAAFSETRNGRQAISATSILVDVGLLYVAPNTAEVSDLGMKYMVNDNLIDQNSKQPTQYGLSLKNEQPNGNARLTAPPTKRRTLNFCCHAYPC